MSFESIEGLSKQPAPLPFSQQLSETTEEVVRSLRFVNFDRMELKAKLESLQESNVVKVLSQTEPNPMAVNAKVVLMLANISTFIHDLNEHSEASLQTLTNTQQVDENETKALLLNQNMSDIFDLQTPERIAFVLDYLTASTWDIESIAEKLVAQPHLLQKLDAMLLHVDLNESCLIEYFKELNPNSPKDWKKAHALYALFLNVSETAHPEITATLEKFWDQAFHASLRSGKYAEFKKLLTYPGYNLPGFINSYFFTKIHLSTIEEADRFLELGPLCQGITSISFGPQISDKTIITLLHQLPGITSLSFTGKRLLTTEFTSQIPNANLTELNISTTFESKGLATLLHAPNLKTLSLENVGTINLAPEQHFHKLQEISLIDCRLPPFEMNKLFTPHLKKVHLEGLFQLSLDEQAQFPKIEELSINGSVLNRQDLLKLLNPLSLRILSLNSVPEFSFVLQVVFDKLEEVELIEIDLAPIMLDIFKFMPHILKLKLKAYVARILPLIDILTPLENRAYPIFTNLRELTVTESFVDSGLGTLLDLTTNLVKLTLTGNIHHRSPHRINVTAGSLQKLEELNLTGSILDYRELSNILKSADNLVKLNLSNYISDLTSIDTLVRDISSLRSLEELKLSLPINDEQAYGLFSSLLDLRVLYLKSPAFTGHFNQQLPPRALQNLKELELRAKTTPVSLNELLLRPKALKNLSIIFDSADYSSDILIEHLPPSAFASLETVKFTDTKIGDQTVAHLLTNAPDLKSLVLNKCANVSDDAFIGNCLNLLETFHITNNSNITNNGIREIFSKTPHLKELNLSFMKQITDFAFTNLTQGIFSGLERLELEDLSITNLNHLPPQALRNLKVLVLKDTKLNTIALFNLLSSTHVLRKLSFFRDSEVSILDRITYFFQIGGRGRPGDLPSLIEANIELTSEQEAVELLLRAPNMQSLYIAKPTKMEGTLLAELPASNFLNIRSIITHISSLNAKLIKQKLQPKASLTNIRS